MKRFKTVQEVSDWRLCLGCGVCAYICPERRIDLVNVTDEGIRPNVAAGDCGDCRLCLDVCPALENDHRGINEHLGTLEELKPYCGPVLEVWEGYAVDPGIRRSGSSGGVITALSLFCIEEEGMHGVLHVGQDLSDPLANKTSMSCSRAELLSKTGSRYAPASACDSLQFMDQAPAPCVFVGQPTEVTAMRRAQALRPELAARVGLAISFFCAGSPSRRGTENLLQAMGVDINEVSQLRYRGNGWPGMFSVRLKGKDSPSHFRTYQESWAYIQAYRPFSTHLCPDGTGEDADISCGDPWYRAISPGEPGESLVVVRTELGRRIIRGAIASGYVVLARAEPWKVLASQKGLIRKRGAIWGRVATLRALGLPSPTLKGFSLFRNWLSIPFLEKLRSTLGTARRVLRRGYFQPRKIAHGSANGRFDSVVESVGV